MGNHHYLCLGPKCRKQIHIAAMTDSLDDDASIRTQLACFQRVIQQHATPQTFEVTHLSGNFERQMDELKQWSASPSVCNLVLRDDDFETAFHRLLWDRVVALEALRTWRGGEAEKHSDRNRSSVEADERGAESWSGSIANSTVDRTT